MRIKRDLVHGNENIMGSSIKELKRQDHRKLIVRAYGLNKKKNIMGSSIKELKRQDPRKLIVS
jgi:hypothetical protein